MTLLPSPLSFRCRLPRRVVSGGGSLVLLGGLTAAVPVAPAVAAPPVTVERAGVGSTTTVALGATQLRPVEGRARTMPLRTRPFSMVAVTWRGPDPGAQVRTRSDGEWGRWHDLEPLGDGPSPGSPEARRAPQGASGLVWVGDADGAQVRTERRSPRSLRLVLIDPGDDPRGSAGGAVQASPAAYVPRRSAGTTTATAAAATGVRTAAADSDGAPRPHLFRRRDWGADNSLRNGDPVYLKTIKQVHLHHTATGNGYSRAEVPAIIRGIYRYHTVTLGWFDIGYNFLVDRFGRAWEGRSGGHWRRVRGAHTLGFNHASTGIAFIGTNRKARSARWKIQRLAAWKFDREGRDADRKIRITSRGSDRYPAGERVRLPAIDGHRDTNQTACPGTRMYNKLPEIRWRTQHRIDRY